MAGQAIICYFGDSHRFSFWRHEMKRLLLVLGLILILNPTLSHAILILTPVQLDNVMILETNCKKDRTSQIVFFFNGVRATHPISDQLCERYNQSEYGNPEPCSAVTASLILVGKGMDTHATSNARVVEIRDEIVTKFTCL
jgi:hypothetical protein